MSSFGEFHSTVRRHPYVIRCYHFSLRYEKKGFFYITDRLWTGDTVKEIVFFPLSSHGATADIYLHIYYNMNTEPFHTARFYFFLKKFSFYH